MKSLKIATFSNPRLLLSLTSLPPQMRLQTVHYAYNPDLDICFITIAMGQRKLSLGLRGLWSITRHMHSVLLSSQIVFKDSQLCVLPWMQVGVLNQVAGFLVRSENRNPPLEKGDAMF